LIEFIGFIELIEFITSILHDIENNY